ncbi:MAG: GNAT family N-acetyltransferase [Candidatus Marinimicrobia bacterium]|nr:GNAT family N-acetyltransferase [Candidatus Neomarinimicrobiota bacterium]MCF7850590.1 GNAT family N-acetyltransferase [Candidatus Neomarinimicrobiota bacterium]MCF7903676.1 GNAT family N-acetyltransferase [Candidatus Neomarinimicrobiota bacterium]
MSRFREFDVKKDRKAAHRIWREINWIEDEKGEKLLDTFLKEGHAMVAEIDGEAECLVTAKPSELRYQKKDLNISVVTSVGTSRIARKQGLAKRLTAKVIAQEAEAGALASTLGIFEQGFYDQLGYGGGSYEHWVTFDPADLKVDRTFDPPKRLSKDDWSIVQDSMINRQKRHGAITLLPPCIAEAELGWTENGFGLGYLNDQEALTHFLWGKIKGESGPFHIQVMAFRNFEQFLELMAVVKSLGDQVKLVEMREPAGIQMQDLILNPFRKRIITKRSEFEHINRANAYWQIRICDLEACVAASSFMTGSIPFNLDLSDPIVEHLDDHEKWQGCGGQYTVTLGPESHAGQGFTKGLPVLKADVGAFSRLWMGVGSATGLAVTGNLSGPEELLNSLDEIITLPQPHPDWDY